MQVCINLKCEIFDKFVIYVSSCVLQGFNILSLCLSYSMLLLTFVQLFYRCFQLDFYHIHKQQTTTHPHNIRIVFYFFFTSLDPMEWMSSGVVCMCFVCILREVRHILVCFSLEWIMCIQVAAA